jgi:transposase
MSDDYIECPQVSGKTIKALRIYKDTGDGTEVLIDLTDGTSFTFSLSIQPTLEAAVIRSGVGEPEILHRYPSPATCWRRLKQWEEQDVWLDAWRALLGALDGEGLLKVGGSVPGWQLRSGQKRGSAVGKTKRGKGTKWMVLVDGGGLPLGVRLESASQGEVTLAEATLAEVKVPRAKGRPRTKPKRVIADRAYDSDPLRERLAKRGIDLIVPYRKNSKHRRYEDGRKLRRYKRRWIIERTNAWLGQFRRLLVRHEHLLATCRAFFYLACLWITLRRCL